MDIDLSFSSKPEWDAWSRSNPWIFDKDVIEATVSACKKDGIDSTFLGFCPPENVLLRSQNYRESLSAHGFNPRQRAVLDIVAQEYAGDKHRKTRIHIHEAITPFARRIQGRFAYVLASEYFKDLEDQSKNFPIPHVDICDSKLPDRGFDLILSQEVFEHVPDLDKAFIDMARILQFGGKIIASVPFLQNRQESLRKARLTEGGEIEHLTDPEYHGNPVDPQGGSLVFELPAWDILDRLKAAGFSSATMRLIGSVRKGIVSNGMAGLLLLVATK
jgi:hypothetical protein